MEKPEKKVKEKGKKKEIVDTKTNSETKVSDNKKVDNKELFESKPQQKKFGDNKSNQSHEPVGAQIKSEPKASECNDKNCHVHGNLKTHGKIFEGKVIKKFPKRVVIEFERMSYVRKYERYAKSKTKIHARLPDCMKNKISVGDLIKVQECRPLSKIIHFVVIGRTR